MISVLPTPAAVLDRQCEQRSAPGFLTAVQADTSHRVMVFQHGKALVRGNEIEFFDPVALAALESQETLDIYLGKVLPGAHPSLLPGTLLMVKVLMDDAESLDWVPEGASWRGYREAAELLNASDSAIFIQAQAIANWHRSHPCCPRCGARTESMSGGWMRLCPLDKSEHFPRTDPAAIVAIVGADDRILLANNFAWEPNRYSTVAGFIEAGESAEQGAIREIAEEVGVRLKSTHYVGSQSWPFPCSLMLGFIAHTDDLQATPDNVEVRAARWFTRAELQADVLSGDAIISRRLSIARELIEHWYGGRIMEPGEAVISSNSGA